MKVELLPSTVGQAANRQFCIGAVVDDCVAIDAGTLGMVWPLERQQKIDHVLLSHSHMDHIATLPLLLDNVYQDGDSCPVIYGNDSTIRTLRQHVFNDAIWPDFVRLSSEGTSFLKLRTMIDEQEVQCGDLRITPVCLNHVVPTSGFIVRHLAGTVAFISDTSPTKRIWELLSKIPDLQAVFLECCFPDSHRELANRSGHLCPEQFAGELDKLGRSDVRIIACHLKPGHYEMIAAELNAMARPQVEIGQPGQCYQFG